jgi:RimJ/RimL family protein N-acetyltransferase
MQRAYAFENLQRKSGDSIMLLTQREDIITPRLALIAITPAMLKSEQADDKNLGMLIRCAIPPNWPPVDWEPHVLDTLLAQYERHPEQMAWHRYVAFLNPDGTRTLIGSMGAFWRDTSPHECEIGYTILPPYEGRGLATEGARALINLIRGDSRMTSIIAHTFPELKASIRVMEKCGLVFDGNGEEAGTVRYRLML